MKEFEDPIYFIALFLHPRCKKMAISRHHTGDSIVRAALEIAKVWHFERRDMIVLCKELINYKNGDPPFDDFKESSNQSGRDIWEKFCGSSPYLRRFAMKVFSIVPHSAPCERLFSILGIMKTKPRNRLAVDKLNMLAQIKCDLASEVCSKKKTSEVHDSMVEGISMGIFDISLEDDGGHELLDEEVDIVVFQNEVQNMEDFFDFEAFEHDNEVIDVASNIVEESNVGGTIQKDKEWSIDDILAACN